MPYALPLPTYVSQNSSRTKVYKAKTAQLGDGYSASAPAGLNPDIDSYSVTFANLNATERSSMWGMLDSVGSWDYFTWRPDGSSAVKRWKVTSEGVSETAVSGELYTISFNIYQTR